MQGRSSQIWKLFMIRKAIHIYIISLSGEDPPEKEMRTHSSILAWRIPWTEQPGRLQRAGLRSIRHDWSYLARRYPSLLYWNDLGVANFLPWIPSLLTILLGHYWHIIPVPNASKHFCLCTAKSQGQKNFQTDSSYAQMTFIFDDHLGEL